MPNEKVSLSVEKKELYEALGVEGVVADLLNRSGEGQSQGVKESSDWLRKERKRLEIRADLRFWIPQTIALLAAMFAAVTVFGGGGE